MKSLLSNMWVELLSWNHAKVFINNHISHFLWLLMTLVLYYNHKRVCNLELFLRETNIFLKFWYTEKEFMQNTLLGKNLPICSKLILTSTLRTRLILKGEPMSQVEIAQGQECRRPNSLMKDYVCEEYYIIKYIVIKRRGDRRGERRSFCILFLLSIISECYLLCSYLFVFFQ